SPRRDQGRQSSAVLGRIEIQSDIWPQPLSANLLPALPRRFSLVTERLAVKPHRLFL
ncbi:hypothetical protein A2U01_0074288, partial [Trifolium medium]|nr:hypothetical protein [Trifolium medium]